MNSRIRQIGDPILRQISSPIAISEIVDADIQALIDHMQSILNGIKSISEENGNALSAPQVGRPIRLILLRINGCLLYTSPSPRDRTRSRMPSSA